jgi:hypothetical protein
MREATESRTESGRLFVFRSSLVGAAVGTLMTLVITAMGLPLVAATAAALVVANVGLQTVGRLFLRRSGEPERVLHTVLAPGIVGCLVAVGALGLAGAITSEWVPTFFFMPVGAWAAAAFLVWRSTRWYEKTAT